MPTLAYAAGRACGTSLAGSGRRTAHRSGRRPGAAHVIGLLWDGGHVGSLIDLALRGELPNVARLLRHVGAR